jgi:hypothetical protein
LSEPVSEDGNSDAELDDSEKSNPEHWGLVGYNYPLVVEMCSLT